MSSFRFSEEEFFSFNSFNSKNLRGVVSKYMNDVFVCLGLLILIIKRHIYDINFSCEVVGKFWLRFSITIIIVLWKGVLNFPQNSVWFIFIFILSFSFYLKYTWSLERVTTRLTLSKGCLDYRISGLWESRLVRVKIKVYEGSHSLPFMREMGGWDF